MENTVSLLMQLIASEACGRKISIGSLSDKEALQIYRLSKPHNMSHLVSAAIAHNGLVKNNKLAEFFRGEMYNEIFRSVKIQEILNSCCSALENAGIDYIPLKGSVIRNYYPESWMRSSTDIDILVRKKDHERATETLVLGLGLIKNELLTHDITLSTREGFPIELHYDLVEEAFLPMAARQLRRVWEYACPERDGSHRYKMNGEMFYFYHIAHMAKHFTRGGCGIRPFLDIRFLSSMAEYNTEKTKSLLEKGGLLKFAEYAEKLCRVWFSGEEHTDITRTMEEFVIEGGCFGTRRGKYIVEQQKKGGKLQYFLARLFIPYSQLKKQYTVIQKYPVLTPFYALKRLWDLAFGKRKKFRKEYINNIQSLPKEKIEEISALWKATGL